MKANTDDKAIQKNGEKVNNSKSTSASQPMDDASNGRGSNQSDNKTAR